MEDLGERHAEMKAYLMEYYSGLLVLLLKEEEKRKRRMVLSCLLAVFTGGSSYITALIAAVLFVTALVLLAVAGQKRKVVRLLVPFLFFFGGLSCEYTRPGECCQTGGDADAPRHRKIHSLIILLLYGISSAHLVSMDSSAFCAGTRALFVGGCQSGREPLFLPDSAACRLLFLWHLIGYVYAQSFCDRDTGRRQDL